MATAATVQTVGSKHEVVKQVKTFAVTLADGSGATLRMKGTRTKAGFRTEAIHKASAKTKAVRGASADHETEASARAAIDAMVKTAEKAGWARKEARGAGFARRPDAFSLASLPRAAKAKK